jgi:hypothetical protein
MAVARDIRAVRQELDPMTASAARASDPMTASAGHGAHGRHNRAPADVHFAP